VTNSESYKTQQKTPAVLIAVDFSNCSRTAMKKACKLINCSRKQVVVLHVIDHDFVEDCIRHHLGKKSQIKKELFLEAKVKLREFLEHEAIGVSIIKTIVVEGIPYLEINRVAEKYDVDMVIIGSCGMVGNTNAVFFGSTTEKVLRFIARPVLCVPPNSLASVN